MSTNYTNVAAYNNQILYRGIKNGRRVQERIPYSPVLFLPTKKQTEWRTLFNEPLEARYFDCINDAKKFIAKYEGVENFKIYGQERFEYAYISDTFKGQINWDINEILIGIIDIEVGSENGFPDPYKAEQPITAISIKYLNKDTYVFGCGDFENSDPKIHYTKCKDEWSLCKTFLNFWRDNCPDVISGWNIDFFDIPYIVNRFKRILGEPDMHSLSPWGNVWERNFTVKGQRKSTYRFFGISALDYIELYKWYAPGGKSQESYKLDNIANVELGENKISYDEYDNLHQLYKLNYQKFIEYNIKDVELIVKLEDKLKLIELALTLAYDTKTNFEDVFAQTRMWDSLIYDYLIAKKVVVPPKVIKEKDSAFEGAYVKEPQTGMHHYIASFDLNSLYPHLLMQYSISPENLVERSDIDERKQKLIQELKNRNI